jgi:hypothetical protein
MKPERAFSAVAYVACAAIVLTAASAIWGNMRPRVHEIVVERPVPAPASTAAPITHHRRCAR